MENQEVFVVARTIVDPETFGILIDQMFVFADEDLALEKEKELRKGKTKFNSEVRLSKIKIQSKSSKSNEEEEKDNPLNPKWPGGFDLANQPITMEEFQEFPFQAKNPLQLSETQKWQLVQARVKRFQNEWIVLPGFEGIEKKIAMDELKAKSDFGKEIRECMIEWLREKWTEKIGNENDLSHL